MEIKQHILNNLGVKENIWRKLTKCFELYDNEHTTYKNTWPAVIAEFIQRGKYLALSAYIRRAERSKAYVKSKQNK